MDHMQIMAEARGWIMDAHNLSDHRVSRMDETDVYTIIQRTYEGGYNSFLTNTVGYQVCTDDTCAEEVAAATHVVLTNGKDEDMMCDACTSFHTSGQGWYPAEIVRKIQPQRYQTCGTCNDVRPIDGEWDVSVAYCKGCASKPVKRARTNFGRWIILGNIASEGSNWITIMVDKAYAFNGSDIVDVSNDCSLMGREISFERSACDVA